MSEIPNDYSWLGERVQELETEIEALQAENKKKLQIPTDDKFLKKVEKSADDGWGKWTSYRKEMFKRKLIWHIELINENL